MDFKRSIGTIRFISFLVNEMKIHLSKLNTCLKIMFGATWINEIYGNDGDTRN
jgi:hypothetical protein